MSNDHVLNLEFPGPNGQKVPVRLTVDGVKSLISQILSNVTQIPLPPDLERTLVLDDSPISANGFAVSPLDGDPSGAHVSIGIGPTNLQFAVSLPVLMQALDDLKQKTEPDPTSDRRLN